MAKVQQLIEMRLKKIALASERGLGFMPVSNCKVSNRFVSIPCNLIQPISNLQVTIRCSNRFFRAD